MRRTRDIKLTLRRPEHFQVDGEYLGEATALRAQVAGGALVVRVPR
ncbi:hypothetical protein [Ruania alba]|nr:hypothetical protein [Ruania alba]